MKRKRNQSADGVAFLWKAEVFQEVYNQNYLIVFRYIFGLWGGPIQTVEDWTAETFIRAWKARYRFHGSQKAALGWLLRIARNLVIDSYRRSKSQGTLANIDDYLLLDPGTSPEEAAILQEESNRLWTRLHTLTDTQREIITLRFFLDWKVKEIANFLKMKENTVSVTIRRSLQQLRQDWPEKSENDGN